jgi:ferrous iron transport protein A
LLGAIARDIVLKVIFKIIRVWRGGEAASPGEALTLGELGRGGRGVVESVGGDRVFRRRLMEMGLTPGTAVALTNVAPLGDPLEIELRNCRLSIRRHEAAAVLLRR